MRSIHNSPISVGSVPVTFVLPKSLGAVTVKKKKKAKIQERSQRDDFMSRANETSGSLRVCPIHSPQSRQIEGNPCDCNLRGRCEEAAPRQRSADELTELVVDLHERSVLLRINPLVSGANRNKRRDDQKHHRLKVKTFFFCSIFNQRILLACSRIRSLMLRVSSATAPAAPPRAGTESSQLKKPNAGGAVAFDALRSSSIIG